MANLKLVSSEYNSVALYYILTSIEDVATNGAVIDGNVPLTSGALAYDKAQNIYCYDGTMWSEAGGVIKLPKGTARTISDAGEPATIYTEQYMTYDFGGQIINNLVNEDPTAYLKAYFCFDDVWYELKKKNFSWGVLVPYFGADPSGTYPALSFDFSEYPFAIANMNNDVALVVPSDPIYGYTQEHTLYGFVYIADS